jgi:hypothetical protein
MNHVILKVHNFFIFHPRWKISEKKLLMFENKFPIIYQAFKLELIWKLKTLIMNYFGNLILDLSNGHNLCHKLLFKFFYPILIYYFSKPNLDPNIEPSKHFKKFNF